MDPGDQVILVLQVILTIGPLAVYFLGLGLASSQAHPCVVSERSDFVLLAVAFVPVMVWPVVALLQAGNTAITLILLSAVVVLFFWLLPRRHDGWVIYNINVAECRHALQRACRRLGWQLEPVSFGREEADTLIQPVGLAVNLCSMPWLRNVTIRCRPTSGTSGGQARRDLLEALSRELRRESLLPSPTGAGLVVIGATLLGLPMWCFFHHFNAIVDVVRRILLA
jgi:hypothetical protein